MGLEMMGATAGIMDGELRMVVLLGEFGEVLWV